MEKDGGDWDAYYLRLGTGSGANGSFTMNGGTLTVKTELGLGIGANSTGAFTMNGGTVKAARVLVNSSATSSLVINGGTFQANGTSGAWIDSPVNVRIGADGATIDTDGGDVLIAPAVNAVDDTAVDFTVTGGGTATFAGGGDLAGALTVGEDTGLRWFDADATVANYAIDSLSLGAGSTLALDADASGCDTFSAATTNLAATAEKKITFKLVVRAMPESGRVFPLFAIPEADAANFDVAAETPAGAPLVVEKGWADGYLTYAIFAKDYVWNDGASGGGWTDGEKWSVDGDAAEWANNNNAVFASAGDAVTLDADVTAVTLDFRANATINSAESSTAAITVPEVIVVPDVTATVNAPISGAFTKKGAGALALGTNRTEQTTLAEGTLALAGATTLDWTKLTFGTDAAKPVTLRVGADATLANVPSQWYVGNEANITSTIVNAGGDWAVDHIYMASAEGACTSFIHEDGTLTLRSTCDFGKISSAAHAYFEIAGGVVTNLGYIHSGAAAPATITVKAGAKFGMSPQDYGMIVSGNASGTLNVEGGDVFVNGPLNLCYRGGPAVVNVTDGGTLTFKKVLLNAGASGGTATITLDGGIMRAYENNTAFIPNKNNLTLTAGANGGTLDTNGKTVTIAKAIGGAGGMAFTGGGTVTFTAANTYAGTTTVEVGTTVFIPSAGAIGAGLAVTTNATSASIADGVYTLLSISGGGTFASTVLDGVEAPEGGTLRLSKDSRSILCIYGDPGYVWIGGASGSLSDASNWANGAVPTGGDSCVIGSAVASELTLGDTFAPAAITFPADSALVTISGERTLTGITSIVNNASQHHVLAFPIDASAETPTLPLADGNYLVFSSGIALTAMPSVANMQLAGVWNLTGNWNEAPSGTTIKSGSTVAVSLNLSRGYNIVVEAGATLRAATATASMGASGQNRFLKANNGLFLVTDAMTDVIQSTGTTSYSLAGLFDTGNGSAVTRANGLVHSASTQANHQFRLNNSGDSVTNTIVLGSGGLSFLDNLAKNSSCYPYFQVDSGKRVVLASSADWSLGANPTSYDLCIELQGALTIDTSDYDDPSVGHTVRSLGRIGNNGSVFVKGCGRLKFEYSSDFAGALTVNDTATVTFNPGCGFTRAGNATVGGSATLEVAQSGTVALGKNLSLADGAALAFNFTEKNAAPVLDVTGKTVTLGSQGNVIVKVSAAEGVRAKGGAYALTSGGKFASANVTLAEKPDWVKGIRIADGEIVLDAKPRGTLIFVR